MIDWAARAAGKDALMRSSGFPCRFGGCDRTFPVTDQSSMEALRAASAARSAHEVADHGYQHVVTPEFRPVMPYVSRKPKKNGSGPTDER